MTSVGKMEFPTFSNTCLMGSPPGCYTSYERRKFYRLVRHIATLVFTTNDISFSSGGYMVALKCFDCGEILRKFEGGRGKRGRGRDPSSWFFWNWKTVCISC